MHTSPVTGWLTDWRHMCHMLDEWEWRVRPFDPIKYLQMATLIELTPKSINQSRSVRLFTNFNVASECNGQLLILLPRCMLQESEINAFVLICGTFYLQHLSSKHCEHFKPSVDSWNGLDAMLRKCPHFTWVLGQRGLVSWLVSNRAPLWHGSN